MLAERLNKAWSAHRSSTAVGDVMRFADEGLVLGAGTVLASLGEPGRSVSIKENDPRLITLLTAAHLRIPSPASLAHLIKGAQRWNEGQEALAAMHLAMSGLDRLRQPEADAHRLFLADELLKAGFGTDAVIAAVDVGDPNLAQLRKYDPDQPRVPAGSGRTSGQWTANDSSDASSSRASMQLQPAPEVNPDTITHVSQGEASIHACDTAEHECMNAALRASRRDTTPVPRSIDISKCFMAGITCDGLSAAVEDGFGGRFAGVRFPHGGFVLIIKGQLDTYHRPRADGSSVF